MGESAAAAGEIAADDGVREVDLAVGDESRAEQRVAGDSEVPCGQGDTAGIGELSAGAAQ